MKVLAVMIEAAALHKDNGDPVAEAAMIQVHDIVAELIAAGIEWDAALQEFANDGQPKNYVRYTTAEARWQAALSKATA